MNTMTKGGRLRRLAGAVPLSRKAVAVSSGVAAVALVAGLAVTGANFVDFANLNLGNGSDDSGIGSTGRFDIAVVTANGTIEQADGPNGFTWDIPNSANLVPGHEISTDIPVFNNSRNFGADTTVTMLLRNGDGRVDDQTPNIISFLRFTAEDEDGAILFEDVTWDQANGALGVLEARAAEPLTQGDTYVAGAADSATVVTLTVEFLDVPGVENVNGGQSAVALRFDAESVTP